MSATEAGQATVREYTGLLGVAIAAADAAAMVIRSGAAGTAGLVWREKSPADFVTEIDTAAEHAVREVVHRELPGAFIIGEELSPDSAAPAGIAFVVDPLDGTTNFLHGYPEYAVSIAVLIDGAAVAGVVLNVPTGDLATAIAGGGATMRSAHGSSHPLRSSGVEDPARALIGTGFPFKHLHLLERYQAQFAEIVRATSGVRRAGSAALDLVDVAAGRFDGFWELVLAPWDFAAGAVIVREAGGVITNLEGEPPPLASSGIIAGNAHIHGWLLRLLQDRGANAT
jgi:myo-inositol-1(or 4)-monophosphatase